GRCPARAMPRERWYALSTGRIAGTSGESLRISCWDEPGMRRIFDYIEPRQPGASSPGLPATYADVRRRVATVLVPEVSRDQHGCIAGRAGAFAGQGVETGGPPATVQRVGGVEAAERASDRPPGPSPALQQAAPGSAREQSRAGRRTRLASDAYAAQREVLVRAQASAGGYVSCDRQRPAKTGVTRVAHAHEQVVFGGPQGGPGRQRA